MIARVAALIGTARPSPIPATAVLMPTTRPAAVGERAAGVARVQRRVGLDDVLDEPARPAVARGERAPEGADDARRHAAGEPERIADRDDELADAQPIRVAERRRRAGRRRSPGSTARSESGSRPTTSKPSSVPSTNAAVPPGAPATTWAEVSEEAVGA